MYVIERLEDFVAGLRTKFLRVGDKQQQPVLVGHGLLGRDATLTAESIGGTAYQAFAPHYPGFFDSEAPKGELSIPWLGGWNYDFHSQVIGRRPMMAVMYSASATFAIHYAATHRGAIEKMVLVEPIMVGGELPGWLRFFIFSTKVPGMAWFWIQAGPNLQPILPPLRSVGWKRRHYLVEGLRRHTQSIGQLARSLRNWDARPEIGALRDVQILIVRGTRQSLVPHDTLTALQGSNITHLELPVSSHFFGKGAQERISEAAREFLRPSQIR